MSKLLTVAAQTVASLACLLLVSCSSTGGAPEGEAARMRVTLRDYKRDQRFELVSESHTSRIDYYSTARDDASRKVQTDTIMNALVEELEKQGFEKRAQAGRAPSSGGEIVTWGLEIESGENTDHWVIGSGSALDDLQDFQECRNSFLQLYNITASYQAIKNTQGKEIFQKPRQGKT